MTDLPDDRRLTRALVVLIAWIAATVLIGAVLRQGTPGSIEDIVAILSSGIAWNVVAGLAVLAVATRAFGWRDLRFAAPDPFTVARLIWFPVLTLVPFYAIAYAVGLPPVRSMVFLAINTSLVALSEEWMFRGVLFQGLRSRLRLAPAVALSSVLFGAVHVLNALALGDLYLALAQALAATMTGLLLVALMLRTGSIWTAVGFHMVWNFGILILAYETARFPLPDEPLPASGYLLPLILVLPNLLYGLILMRKVQDHPSGKP